MTGYREALRDYLLADGQLAALTGDRVYLIDQLGPDGVTARTLNTGNGIQLAATLQFRVRQVREVYERNRLFDVYLYDDIDKGFANIEIAFEHLDRLLHHHSLEWADPNSNRKGSVYTWLVLDGVQLYDRKLQAAQSVGTFKLIEQER